MARTVFDERMVEHTIQTTAERTKVRIPKVEPKQASNELSLENFSDWQGLIPPYWSKIFVDSYEDVMNLGQANLIAMKREWRNVERVVGEEIRNTQEQVDFLCDKTVSDLETLSYQYDYPELPSLGFYPDVYNGMPEPLDVASKHRRREATTLNLCGWCKYICNAVLRHNYAIAGCCGLSLPLYLNGSNDWSKVPELSYDTPCALICGGDDFLDRCKRALLNQLKELREEKAEIGRRIRFIDQLVRQAEEKPCFVFARPSDWFHDRDMAVCLVHDLSFVPAHVIAQFAVGEVTYTSPKSWMLSVRTNQKVHLGRGDGHGLNCNVTRPEIMLHWEYEYLIAHPRYRELWLLAATGEASESYIEALRGAFKQEPAW